MGKNDWMYYPPGHPSAGFLNVPAWDKHDTATFKVAVSGRQIGKTFGVMEYIHNVLMEPYVYLRSTVVQQQFCMSEKSNFFEKQHEKACEAGHPELYDWCEHIEIRDGSKDLPTLIYDDRYKDGKLPIGIATSLQGMHNIKGFVFSSVKHIIFDEFIEPPKCGMRGNRGYQFCDAYTTINSNREVNGGQPVKVWCLANAVNVADDIPVYMRWTTPLLELQNKGRTYSYLCDRDVSLIFPSDSPISEKMQRSALFRALGKDHEYTTLACGNTFVFNDQMGVEHRDIRQYAPMCVIDDMVLYRERSGGGLYLVLGTTNKNVPRFDTGSKTHKIECRRWINERVWDIPIDGKNIYYSNYECKVVWYDLLGIDKLNG